MKNINTSQPAIPAEVAQALSYLANMIDAGLEVRGAIESPRAFAAHHLKVPITEVGADERMAGYYEFFAVGRAATEFMDESVVFATMGHSSNVAPTWDSIRIGDRTVRHPVSLFAAVTHPDWDAPIVIGFTRSYQGRFVSVFYRVTDEDVGSRVLDHLWSRSKQVANPFVGAVLSVTAGHGRDFAVSVATHRPLDRFAVILPIRVWAELDVNVAGLLEHHGELAERGLSATRGILLHGPPGTGKSAAIRAIVTEQRGRATVLMCNAGAVVTGAADIMKLAADLAPSIVVIEDIDRLITDRNHEFLVALDGVEIDRTGVVLIATANDASAMGAAALRSARFDVKIEVPLPDAAARRAILVHYLGGEVIGELGRVVAATDGASGADLREIVSAALLAARTAGHPVSTTQLLETARDRFNRVADGFYL